MKIGIVGSGKVGATAAFAMVMRGIGREIVLVDRTANRAKAEAYDISHAVPFAHPLIIRQGDYGDLEGSRVVIVTAGVPQEPGESRLDLLKRNAAVFAKVIPEILRSAAEAVLVVVTNPVDIMTYVAVQYALKHGLPGCRVLGSGTALDTARFRTLLGERIGVDPRHIHGYVIGEHGDSEVLAWSLVTVGSMKLQDYCSQQGIRMDAEVRRDIDRRVRYAAYEIIEEKGATYYGIGSTLAELASVILHDQRSILTVSAVDSGEGPFSGLAISMPHLIGGDGALAPISIAPDTEEDRALQESAATIRRAINDLNKGL